MMDRGIYKARTRALSPLLFGYWEGFVNAASDVYKESGEPESALSVVKGYARNPLRKLFDPELLLVHKSLSCGQLSFEKLADEPWQPMTNIAMDGISAECAVNIGAVANIWLHALSCWDNGVLPSPPCGIVSPQSICQWIDALALSLGIPEMMSAYFSGVPIEDVIS